MEKIIMKANLVSERLNFERSTNDPFRHLGVGLRNNPSMILEKFHKDFEETFGINLVAKEDGRFFQVPDKDVIYFKPSDDDFIIESLLHNHFGEGLFIVLTEKSATEIFDKPTKPGWFGRHQPPSSGKVKNYYFNDLYFMPEVLKKLKKLRGWDPIAQIERRKIEIAQLEKLKNL